MTFPPKLYCFRFTWLKTNGCTCWNICMLARAFHDHQLSFLCFSYKMVVRTHLSARSLTFTSRSSLANYCYNHWAHCHTWYSPGITLLPLNRIMNKQTWEVFVQTVCSFNLWNHWWPSGNIHVLRASSIVGQQFYPLLHLQAHIVLATLTD